MRAPEMTEEQKNDLTVLQMRQSLDPKRFYKGPDIRGLPKFFQVKKRLFPNNLYTVLGISHFPTKSILLLSVLFPCLVCFLMCKGKTDFQF